MSNVHSPAPAPAVADLAPVAADLVAAVGVLVHARCALDLRTARLLGWIKGQDLAPRGYSRFANFARAHVDWGDTWLNLLLRLATSGLDRVQAAACAGILPLTLAVKAPGHIRPDEQEGWIAAALAGTLDAFGVRHKVVKPDPPPTVDVEGDILRDIHAARQRARLVTAHALSDPEADRFILRQWKTKARGADLVAKALEPPPPPPPLPPAYAGEDTAATLVGPWVEPGSLPDAEEKLAYVLTVRRERLVRMGQLLRSLKEGRLYRAAGYDTLAALATSLGVSKRTLERACALAETLDTHPVLAERGLSIDQIEHIGTIATEETVEAWAFVAHYTGVGEFVRAVRMAKDIPGVLEKYLEAARIAGIATFNPSEPPAPTPFGVVPTRATRTVARAESLRPPPPPRYDRVDADLPVAARWFLANVRLPRLYGIGAIKTRDHHTCRNPECACLTLRLHVHHYTFRSRGGTDDPFNLGGFCPGCHLRLVHSNRIRVTREGALTTYEFPGRTVVVVGAGTGE